MDNSRGLIPAQIPKRFGRLHPHTANMTAPNSNIFRAQRLLLTFAEVQTVITEYRKRQADPATRIPEISE